MFFTKFFQFLHGYVIIRLEGFSIERFMNICLRRGIHLWNIIKTQEEFAQVCLSNQDFKRIRPVAFKTHTKVRIQKKCGFPDLFKRYKKRYCMLGGLLLFTAALAVSSQFIWTVEIQGNEKVSAQQIYEILLDNGVCVGAYKKGLPTAGVLKEELLTRAPGLSWAWVYFEGTKARVEVKESILPPVVVDKSIACDVVAMCDGLLKHVEVKNGQKVIEEGNAVLRGETIISGTVKLGKEEEPESLREIYVHALGEVQAYTWHEKSGEYKLYHEVRQKTGERKNHYTIQLFSKNIKLFAKDGISYQDYDKIENRWELKLGRTQYLGIGLTRETYEEVEVHREPVSVDAALEIARDDLEQQIAEELLPGADLQERNLEYTQLDEDTIKATLTMKFIEKIGTEKPMEE